MGGGGIYFILPYIILTLTNPALLDKVWYLYKA